MMFVIISRILRKSIFEEKWLSGLLRVLFPQLVEVIVFFLVMDDAAEAEGATRV